MRIRLSILLALVPSLLFGQVWEKFVAPGITYRMEVDASVPRIVHAVRFNAKSPDVKMLAEIGRPFLLADDPLKGRKTVSQAVTQTGALGGINADFFPFTGEPLGLLVRNGELLINPNPIRSVFAWGNGETTFGKASWTATLQPEGGAPVKIDAINQECGTSGLVVVTPSAGLATVTSKTQGVFAVVKSDGGNWTPDCKISGEVQVLYEVPSMSVQPGNFMLVGTGAKAQALKELTPGRKVTVQIQVKGFDWAKYPNAVGGGPDLLRNGQVSIDGVAQDFSPSAFIDKRHPRSAVGRTADGDLWFVVVDGRQKMSDGASLKELADIMAKLGCTDAINLDGGGSSCLNLLGVALNRPCEGRERPVADMILFGGTAPAPEPVNLSIETPTKLQVGDQVQLSIKSDKGETVPNVEVLWSAMGAAWIDQGGLLHCFEVGKATIRAEVKGHLIELAIPVEAKPSCVAPAGRDDRKRP
jgi:hypothetical protein